MNSLRWTLATATALLTISFVALLILADGFRNSFGASENEPWIAGLPLAVMFIFLASLLLPKLRALLHVTATTALALTGCSLWVLQESIFVGTMGLLYAGLWGSWYWHTVWQQAPKK
jgi:hypothetical protein